MLQAGRVRPRPKKGYSQAFSGVHPISSLTHSTQRFQPLPPPLGQPAYRYDLESVLPGIGAQAVTNGKIVFHCVGDTGGIKHPDYQTHVADAMKADLGLPAADVPSFFYHLITWVTLCTLMANPVNTTVNFTSHTTATLRQSSPSPATTTATRSIARNAAAFTLTGLEYT